MLDTEPQIIENYVKTGQVQIVFWPVLNHGDSSTFATLTAECAAQQSTDLFWDVHKKLFENLSDLWGATRDELISLAVEAGAEQATFEACFDGPDGLSTVLALDQYRRDRGIYSQPIFDINNQIFAGYQRVSYFDEIFAALLDG